MEDGPINLASKSSQAIVDSNSNQELPPDPATSLTSSPPTKELQSSTVSSVILEPMDRDGNAMERDSLSNIIVDPMDRVVLGSRSPGNIDMKQLDSSSPGNTPTPTGCTSPGPMMEEEEIRPVLQEAWPPMEQMEEQMDLGGSSPAGTPTPGSPSSTPPPLCLRELPSSTTTPLDHRDLSRPLDNHRDCRDGS